MCGYVVGFRWEIYFVAYDYGKCYKIISPNPSYIRQWSYWCPKVTLYNKQDFICLFILSKNCKLSIYYVSTCMHCYILCVKKLYQCSNTVMLYCQAWFRDKCRKYLSAVLRSWVFSWNMWWRLLSSSPSLVVSSLMSSCSYKHKSLMLIQLGVRQCRKWNWKLKMEELWLNVVASSFLCLKI